MKQEILKSDYWSKDKILSYNCIWNFIVGARSIGKTYAFKDWAISSYLKDGSRAAVVMHTVDEIEVATETEGGFFADIEGAYPDYEFRSNRKKGEIRLRGDDEAQWEPFIMFKGLTSKSLKAISQVSITKIIFDEFIPTVGTSLSKNVVDRFLELVVTIKRTREVRIFMLSNNVTPASPFFSAFNISLPSGGEIKHYKEKDIVIENCRTEKLTKKMMNDRFVKSIAHLDYANYAYGNQSFIDTSTFVHPRPENAKCILQLSTSQGAIFLWTAQPHSIFICEKGDPSCLTFAVESAMHNDKTILMDFSGVFAKNMLKRAYRIGALYFDTPLAKAIFMGTCSKLIER